MAAKMPKCECGVPNYIVYPPHGPGGKDKFLAFYDGCRLCKDA